jgi:nicotinamidase-related amidase
MNLALAFTATLLAGLTAGYYLGSWQERRRLLKRVGDLYQLREDLSKAKAELDELKAEFERIRAARPKLPEPEPMALQARTTALIVVDMQNDFCKPEGRLFVGPSATATIPRIKELLERARAAGAAIIYTLDWHPPDDPEFKMWPAHCVQGTWGAEVVDELKPRAEDHLVRKSSYDPFFTPKAEPSLESLLRGLGVDTVVVAGTVSNICVMHTVAGASLRGFKVIVPVDCISALNIYGQELAIFQASFLYRAKITASNLVTFM